MAIPFRYTSFYAHILNGLLLLVAMILFVMNYSAVMRLDSYKRIMLALAFSLAAGIHGIFHLGLENIYGYNPMQSVF